jgi:uncharacterized caspase-like protein
MRKLFLSVVPALCGLILATLASNAALAERRVALVIGNSAYRSAATLPNTLNDATVIATMFKNAGFDVVEMRQDLGVLDFKRAVREFMNTSRNADIAVVYYAGHGIESAGTNYLIPVDAKLASDYDAEDEAVSLDRVILALQPAERLRLIILDACRDNPFVNKMQRAVAIRAVPNGLAKIEPTTADTLIAYAAKAGSVSYEGTGPNSPFTTALVKYLAEPGLDIRIALGRVRDEVIKSTGKRQEPFVYGSLGGTTISLVPPRETPKVEAAPPAASESEVRRAYELTAQLGTREAWGSFLKVHQMGFYADLAREQLAKMNAAAEDRAARERSEKERGEHLAAKQRQEEEQGVKAEAERQKAALRPNPEPVRPEQSCKRDEERLAKLRANPTRDDVVRFARELDCEDLRPQVLRLLESVSPASTAAVPPVPVPVVQDEKVSGQTEAERQKAERESAFRSEAKPAIRPKPQEQACEHDAERLNGLRANPTREDVVRFSRELACEELRPQVARLLESLGD